VLRNTLGEIYGNRFIIVVRGVERADYAAKG